MQCISRCIEVRPIKRRVLSTDAVLISLSADTRARYPDPSGVCSVLCVPSPVLQADARHCRALSKTALCSQPHNRMRSTRLESLASKKGFSDGLASLLQDNTRTHRISAYSDTHSACNWEYGRAKSIETSIQLTYIVANLYVPCINTRKHEFEGKMRCVDRNVIACTERMSAELIMLHVDHRTLAHFTKMKSLNVERYKKV